MTAGAAAARAAISRSLAEVRAWTHALLDPLDDDEVHRQVDPIMSPLVWDLGHIGTFEQLWLLRALGHRTGWDAGLAGLYNPFEHPRWTRADLAVLPRADAVTYLADIRSDALRLLAANGLDPAEPLLAGGYVYRMVVQHEAQHQETMLQALDLRPDAAAYPLARERRLSRPRAVDDAERVVVGAGRFWMGSADPGAYDNERPVHQVDVGAFAVDRFPVTNRRYADFLDAGGYERPELWSERGWAWRTETGHRWPQGWIAATGGGWHVRRFGHVASLDPREPVEHVSCFEAEAFATWAGGRLPTEAEWEKAACWDPAAGRSRTYPWGEAPPTPARANLDRRGWGPAPVGSCAAGASAYGVEQLAGDVFEWTSSPFAAYPGYVTFPYPEYSESFFGGDYRVLRGSSWATRPVLARASFRNWDHPYRRQIFAGLRVAYDLPAGQPGGRTR
ncbi:MAG TPA: ergothioneine biosynthesis protein EgtB [Egibacteraceae bacterium]|nr:ergothioneine biosynthesis protein EgtB [Egibacteraceae bacterium]